jgi:hypothetical protein
MLWTVAGVVGLVVTLAAGLLVGIRTIRERRELLRTSTAFRCRLRLVSGWLPPLRRTWRGRRCWATWVHDVLLVRRGVSPRTTTAYAVRFPEGSVEAASAKEVRGLGPQPLRLRLRLDDGAVLELAAPGEAMTPLVGPFVVAAMNTLGSQATDTPPGR